MNKTVKKDTEEIQELLIRLERNNHTVDRLSKKLSSYTCEPNDRSCFEKLDNLRRSFNIFREQQNNLFRLLRQKKTGSVLHEQIEMHLKRFKDLEEEIAAYILTTQKYY